MTTEPYDVLVLGGGPAGSTFAGIVKKYAPDVRVVVLERARFPRWRVGESSIPVANGVLRDLGMFDRLAADPSVVKKIGVTFVVRTVSPRPLGSGAVQLDTPMVAPLSFTWPSKPRCAASPCSDAVFRKTSALAAPAPASAMADRMLKRATLRMFMCPSRPRAVPGIGMALAADSRVRVPACVEL